MTESALTFWDFVDELQAFADDLPSHVTRSFEREADGFFSLTIEAPSKAHRRLAVSGDERGLEFSLGPVWTEGLVATPAVMAKILAACDAIRAGAVRECRDRRTGVIYHVYRLRTRGLREFIEDGQYSLWSYLKLKVRKVSIHRVPPLEAVG